MTFQFSAQDPIRIMLVDDSAVIRGGLSALLEHDPAIKIIASVSNGQMAVDTVASKKPDIVIQYCVFDFSQCCGSPSHRFKIIVFYIQLIRAI